MNRLFAYPTLIFAAALLAGCTAGAPTDDDVSSSSSEALSSADDPSEDDDDADANVEVDVVLKHRAAFKLTLSSFDGTTLVGTARNGTVITATAVASTKYRTANLDRFIPTDPCRGLAAAYNLTITNPGQIDQTTSTAISSLAGQGCRARVHLVRATGAIRAFRAVP
jgi:hypothetical protein